jgi:large subunit ribosomal protein L18
MAESSYGKIRGSIGMRTEKKFKLAKLRRWRIRKKITGTKGRPRMSVRFTGKNIYVQFIDDDARITLSSTSTLSKSVPNRDKLSANVVSARQIGQLAAAEAKSKGIQQVVFDRSGARFHGKVKALADAAREAGLQF